GAVPVEEPDLRAGTGHGGADSEAAANAEGTEDAGVEPAEGATRPDDVARGGDEVAAVDDEHAVVVEDLLDGAAQSDGVDVLGGRGRLLGDLRVAGPLALAEGLEEGRDAVAHGPRPVGEGAQEGAGVRLNGEGGPAVLLELRGAAVDRDDRGAAVDPEAVAHAEVEGEA